MIYNIPMDILKIFKGQLERNRPLERPVYQEVADNKINLKEWTSKKQNEIN